MYYEIIKKIGRTLDFSNEVCVYTEEFFTYMELDKRMTRKPAIIIVESLKHIYSFLHNDISKDAFTILFCIFDKETISFITLDEYGYSNGLEIFFAEDNEMLKKNLLLLDYDVMRYVRKV